mgnify:CR=1 FL=1
MPNHPRQLQRVEDTGQPGDGFVPGIVKRQVMDAGPLPRRPEQRGQRQRLEIKRILRILRQTRKQLQRPASREIRGVFI